MAEPTQQRGSDDALPGTPQGVSPSSASLPLQFPGVRAASHRALRAALLVAFLVHIPLVPSPLAAWISMLLSLGEGEVTDYDDEPTIIPLDLDLLASDPTAANQAPSADPAATAPPAPPDPPPAPAPAAPTPAPSAAGVEPSAPDAGAPDAGPLDAGPLDAGPTDKPPPDNGRPRLRDPLAVAGAPGKLASKDPNVQVLIAGDRLRNHDLGAWFGRVLTLIPEWQSFFSGSSVDPIRDLDHLLLAGPQFRNSSRVIAVMDYRVPETAIREAVDGIVQRTNGTWLPDAPIPAARARADRADRVFALVPSKKLLVILPADQEGELDKLKSLKPFNRSSAVGIVISMLTPQNAFRGLYKLPKTLKWMRLTVTPTKDGGADLALAVGDGSPEDARDHAEEFTRNINAVRTADLGIMKVDVLDEVTFTADGDVLWTRLHVQSKQLKLIMGFVEQALKDQAAARPRRDEPARDEPSPRSTSTSAPTAAPPTTTTTTPTPAAPPSSPAPTATSPAKPSPSDGDTPYGD
ncbi:hypothetical protein [Chondromyces apiculatus]|uniref:Uncharacterized protein n=1 Tax=Chondromyces apiculatus DSM 436 TaxID=1192034 RepID=A0A017SXF0_9BACT|nr:hypothetical protein [Chondromyces apiculatus]EYF01618.1 Hypothetical protein CAP_7937 [Chondromyces apiculatus DSM 436]